MSRSVLVPLLGLAVVLLYGLTQAGRPAEPAPVPQAESVVAVPTAQPAYEPPPPPPPAPRLRSETAASDAVTDGSAGPPAAPDSAGVSPESVPEGDEEL